MTDIRTAALALIRADIRRASRAMDEALKPPRLPVNYHGKLINTHERAQKLRKR